MHTPTVADTLSPMLTMGCTNMIILIIGEAYIDDGYLDSLTNDTMELPVSITEENGTFVAVCNLFHVASQGRTENEAICNIKEALELFLEELEHTKPNLYILRTTM